MSTSIDDWPTFAAALALTLARMPADACLIVGASGNRYVQFTVMPADAIAAEVVDDAFLGGDYCLSWDDKARLVADGWIPPSGSLLNWTTNIVWPPRYRDFEDVAERAVAALHEILKVTTPAELTVESWVNFTGENFDVSALA